MKIYSLTAEHWKMDGGSCFGIVPKTIWKKFVQADENNRITITSRCLLVQDENRLILFDTGMGNKQSEKFYAFVEPFNTQNLVADIRKAGFTPEDVTDVVFTHLHWDHTGGATTYDAQGNIQEVFPNAQYWCSRSGWESALNPNSREEKGFELQDLLPLENSGKLNFIEEDQWFTKNIEFRIFNGHTDGLIVPFLHCEDKTFVFLSDFIPSSAHFPLAFVAPQDIRPLVTIAEKKTFLDDAVEKGYYLIFIHDYLRECCTVKRTEKGVGVDKFYKVEDI